MTPFGSSRSIDTVSDSWVPTPSALESLGWSRTGSNPGRYDVWWTDAHGGRELILPTNPEKSDYTSLANRAVRLLEALHGEAAAQRAKTFHGVRLDSTHWKKETSVPAGLISWTEGQALYDSARLQLVAAAKSSKEPRPYHHRASAYVAKRFLENSFMGQTMAGSYVITAHTPRETPIFFSKHDEMPGPTSKVQGRSVSGAEIMETFEVALDAVKGSLDEYKRTAKISVFQEAFLEGVSYEFTKALSLFSAGSASAIEIQRTTGTATSSRTKEVTFDPPDANVLERAANAFMQDPHARRVLIRGEVTDLSRNLDFDKRIIRLEAAPGSAARLVRLRLNATQYEEALRAHRDQVPLEVSGVLEKDRQRYWIYNPEQVRAAAPKPMQSDAPSDPQLPIIFDE